MKKHDKLPIKTQLYQGHLTFFSCIDNMFSFSFKFFLLKLSLQNKKTSESEESILTNISLFLSYHYYNIEYIRVFFKRE